MPSTARQPVLCIIVATAENGVIGRDGKMAWHLPAELKYFRSRTIGKPVIMGRKTFQSIGKPLPGRANIVVTRDRTFSVPGIAAAADLAQAVDLARRAAADMAALEIMIIGGAEIYAQALPLVQRVYLTRVALTVDGDARFPALPASDWHLVSEQPVPGSAADTTAAVACVYDRVASRT